MTVTNMFITGRYHVVEVALRLIPPHEAEMILSDYKRETGSFQPESVKLSWSQLSDGAILWPQAEVVGRRCIKRGAMARVKYAEDDDGEIRHWPGYVMNAFELAKSSVKS
jgi:hypothetical protein